MTISFSFKYTLLVLKLGLTVVSTVNNNTGWIKLKKIARAWSGIKTRNAKKLNIKQRQWPYTG